MSVDYKVIAKGQPGVAGGGKQKFYASIVRGKKVDLRTFMEEIAENNTLTTSDILAVLESFLQKSAKFLAEGRTVDLGQLGSFTVGLQSNGEETAAEVDKHSIKGLKVSFKPSADLTKKLSTVTYTKVGGLPTEEEQPEN